ncbi:MAG: hypothetical protein K2K26_05680, partial [Muribaculaceae bacterium]|nr:hypothetical protein [Muribaculaceae bacterium]
TYRNLGIDETVTRNHSTPKVIDIINSLSEEELNAIINLPYSQEVIKHQEEAYDRWFSTFFNHFSAEDYVLLSKTIDEYLEYGGNNVNRVIELGAVFSDEALKLLFINTCICADCLADKNFWLNPNIKNTAHRISGNEITCRTAFWNKLRLISLTATAPEAIELACLSGPLLPTIEELEAAAAVLGAADAAWDYYACTHYGIH